MSSAHSFFPSTLGSAFLQTRVSKRGQQPGLQQIAAKQFRLLCLLLLVGPASAQVARPYAYGGLSLNSGGYSTTAGTIGAGLNIDTPHAVGIAEISADNAHKQDSGTGHNVGGRARAFYRTEKGWYCGGGAQWSKLSTRDYSKQAWRPTFGGGKDFMREDFSIRTQVMYVLPGTDHLNAVQGPEISVWIPSPATKSHIFYRQTLGAYGFHQTSVPGNPGTGNRSVASFLDFTIMYRF